MGPHLSVLIFICAVFMAGGAFAATPIWRAPSGPPPTNNVTQQVTWENYVLKSTTTPQIVTGAVDAAQNTNARIFSGDDVSRLLEQRYIGIRAQDGNATGTLPGVRIGVFGSSTSAGIYGHSQASGAGQPTELYAGILGRSNRNNAVDRAAEFRGPVSIQQNASNGAAGNLTVEGMLTLNKSLECLNGICTPQAGAWLTGAHTTGGMGIVGQTTEASRYGIEIDIIKSSASTSAIDANATGNYAVQGYGPIGIYGKSTGDAAQTTRRYRGLYGIGDVEGVHGQSGNSSGGGIGSVDYNSGSGLLYDFAAGVRACVRNSSGVPINANGLKGDGGSYAGRFYGDASNDSLNDGDVMIIGKEVALNVHNILTIGNTTITKKTLRGLLCRTCKCNPTLFAAYAQHCTAIGQTCTLPASC